MATEAPTRLTPAPIAPAGAKRALPRLLGDLSTARLIVTVALITGAVGAITTVGADARWLAALGRIIAHRHAVPDGIPFAAAPTAHWHNPLALAELIFHALESLAGDRGLVLAQIVAVAAGFGILAADASAGGARSFGTASALSLAAIGAVSSLAIARVQMFSLVLFPLLVALLRAEARSPSRRIWLALPLLALWANLHGAVLSGVAVLYAYLALDRARRDRPTALAVALAVLPAICLTPAGVGTVAYYHDLVTNLAAQRGVGLWAPLGSSGLDWVLIAAAGALIIRLRARRPRLWEIAVIVGLGVLTVQAARSGVWLLFVLVAPAAHATRVKRDWNGLLPVGAAIAALLLALAVAHPPHTAGASPAVLSQAISLAHGTPILADGQLAEQVALQGGRIWAGNPIDAFSRRDQAAYLDFMAGAAGGRAALRSAGPVVLVTSRSAAQALTRSDPAGYRDAGGDASTRIYVRR